MESVKSSGGGKRKKGKTKKKTVKRGFPSEGEGDHLGGGEKGVLRGRTTMCSTRARSP